MADPDRQRRSKIPAANPFVTTHWSAVVRAGHADTAQGREALAELCQTYWYPLYAFIRRQGLPPHDAEDLTQGFFAKLLEKNYVADASQEKGRFRTFLLTALKRFMANEWDRRHAQKRGAFQPLLSIDQNLAESRFNSEPSHTEQPDRLFERHWATALLSLVMHRLKAEYVASERALLFEHLRNCLTKDDSALPYAEIAKRVDTTEAAIKVAAHRLRTRYREILREEISKTVTTPEAVDDEIRHLFSIL